MNSVTALLTGAGLGCLAMYELDPEMGRRRRALVRDQAIKMRQAGEAASLTARDLRNRAADTLAEGGRLVRKGEIPGLKRKKARTQLDILQNWVPATRFLIGLGTLIGLTALAYAFSDFEAASGETRQRLRGAAAR